MRTSLSSRIIVTFMFSISLVSLNAPRLRADSKDTPEVVIKAAQDASFGVAQLLSDLTQRAGRAGATAKADINSQINAVRKLQALITHLGQDRAFAKQVLDLSVKNDKVGLGALWGREVGGRCEIRNIQDWWVYGLICTNGWLYEACLGAGCKGAVFTLTGKCKSS
jgi:hypothetical protein